MPRRAVLAASLFALAAPAWPHSQPSPCTTLEACLDRLGKPMPDTERMALHARLQSFGPVAVEAFVTGPSNRFAHAAALAVAEQPAQAYNPFFVYGGVGLGKTHLLHAIGHQVRAQGRRVIYLTADRFMYGFVASLKAQTSLAFKERLRGIDLLILDDVQFIQGKQIQQEFGHTLNALIDAGRQIVVAADRPPADRRRDGRPRRVDPVPGRRRGGPPGPAVTAVRRPPDAPPGVGTEEPRHA